MLSPTVEKLSINVVNGAVELASWIPPQVWAVFIGWYLLRRTIRHNSSKA